MNDRRIFGWSYPPGVTGNEPEITGDWDWICECCNEHSDDCECPECPVCFVAGDPECHNLGHFDTERSEQ